MEPATPAERLAQVEQTIAHVRTMDGEMLHTPVMVAAGGPRALSLAARTADIVAIPAGALASRDEFKSTVGRLREAAGERMASLELSLNIFVVGDEVPPWMQRFLNTDIATMIRVDSLSLLRGSVTDMADELRRRRDAYGVSYVTVNVAFYEQFAPLVEKLAGT
jgi:alkanesulfonate monooxygenase SsuD/methylene tetrahydromethanopterin reductase-like flavin-dependent oxidoreductase (luciferase family)